MVRRLLGEQIDLRFTLDERLGNVKADRGHLEQVLLNLLVNARDAMPGGGKLTVETANVALDENYVRGHLGAKPGEYVMLAVTDSGTGMDAETQTKIFLPFFTTKEVGKGTGLGLAMVHGVVKQAGGEIFVYSTPGKGTTFKVYLPRVDEAGASSVSPTVSGALGGTETILLVEDEAAVRRVAERVLSKAGYRLLVAESPSAALALTAKGGHRFDLLLTDVIMPGMDGPTLAATVRKTHASVRVVFMSGYTGGALMHQGLVDDERGYLLKPFTPKQLLERVREILDRR
jgi:CheY-like chemotaxis protein